MPRILLPFILDVVSPRIRAIAWLAANQGVAKQISYSRGEHSDQRDANGGQKAMYHLQLL